MSNLVIVESAAKSKTITKYLNNSKELKNLGKFVVAASFGHVRDLKKEGLGIDIDHNFKTEYDVIPDKKKVVDDLTKKVKEASNVYIASDPDREGESIAQHLKEVLKLKNYKRITFTEITPKALENAIKNPRKIDEQLVDAQETRRILDRLVGFKLSPLLWKKYNTHNAFTLSAGRVQSAVLHIIIEKEKEIEKFETKAYWNFNGDFSLILNKDKQELTEIKLYKDTTIYKVDDYNDVVKFLGKNENKWIIDDITTKQAKHSADLPYITSTLQQDAYSKLGMTLKRSMQIAQELYENGHITYMRTDSFNMSTDFKDIAKSFIDHTYGTDYYEGGSSRKKIVKNAQEAHECIRITNPTMIKLQGEKFGKDHISLYDMIWKRTIAYLLKPSIYDELEIKIYDKGWGKNYYFNAVYKKVKFNGYLIVYGIKNDVYDFKDMISNKSKYTIQASSITAKNVWMSPPQRFNESSIVKTLESESIGRPSTYSVILSKLFDRKYVLKSNIAGIDKDVIHLILNPNTKNIKKEKGTTKVGAETSKLVPTEVGIEINKYLEEHFDYIVDKNFTAYMENDLDKIAEGDKDKLSVLKLFWSKFSVDLAKEQNKTKEKKIKLETENNELTVQGKKYIIRLAKYGPVIQEGTNYINLKSYLAMVKKQYTDINEDDIKFLTNLPRNLQKIDGHMAVLVYGPYGLYIKYNNKNISITRKFAKIILENGQYDAEMIKSMIDYQNNKKKDSK